MILWVAPSSIDVNERQSWIATVLIPDNANDSKKKVIAVMVDTTLVATSRDSTLKWGILNILPIASSQVSLHTYRRVRVTNRVTQRKWITVPIDQWPSNPRGRSNSWKGIEPGNIWPNKPVNRFDCCIRWLIIHFGTYSWRLCLQNMLPSVNLQTSLQGMVKMTPKTRISLYTGRTFCDLHPPCFPLSGYSYGDHESTHKTRN
jgi:hypothetical protein